MDAKDSIAASHKHRKHSSVMVRVTRFNIWGESLKFYFVKYISL